MNIPGFSAQSSLYKTQRHYTASSGTVANGAVVPQRIAPALANADWDFCSLACFYCVKTGYFCWPCYICAWFIDLGWYNRL
jgi:hypothetical protein